MDNDLIFEDLLRTMRDVYIGQADMMAFAPFPNDIARQVVHPYHCACSDAFQRDTELSSKRFRAFEDAIRAASNHVHWRETYRDTDIGNTFMDMFGCYCLVGDNAPFSSEHIRLFMVYMPPGLYYPWHQHPAEEIYLVLSGSAVFRRKGTADEVLSEGETSFHFSNQPHAMETMNEPVLCLVAWRDQFEIPPVLSKL